MYNTFFLYFLSAVLFLALFWTLLVPRDYNPMDLAQLTELVAIGADSYVLYKLYSRYSFEAHAEKFVYAFQIFWNRAPTNLSVSSPDTGTLSSSSVYWPLFCCVRCGQIDVRRRWKLRDCTRTREDAPSHPHHNCFPQTRSHLSEVISPQQLAIIASIQLDQGTPTFTRHHSMHKSGR